MANKNTTDLIDDLVADIVENDQGLISADLLRGRIIDIVQSRGLFEVYVGTKVYEQNEHISFTDDAIYKCLTETLAGENPTTKPSKWKAITIIELRDAITNLEENQVTGVEVYSTYADEGGGASFLPVSGTLLVSYKVANDPDTTLIDSPRSNNGYYHWSGSVYIKDADLTNGKVEEANTEAVKGGNIYESIKMKANLTAGVNKFDKTKVTDGHYISHVSGLLILNAPYSASEFIEIEPETDYAMQGTIQQSAWYDKDRVYISGVTDWTANGGVNESPIGAKYVRLSCFTTELDNVQFEEGSSQTDYEDYEEYISENNLNTDKFQIMLPTEMFICSSKVQWAYVDNFIYNSLSLKSNAASISLFQHFGKTATLRPDKIIFDGTGTNYNEVDVSKYNKGEKELLAQKLMTTTILATPTGKTINTLIVGDSFIQYGTIYGNGIQNVIKSNAVIDGNTVVYKGTKTYPAYNNNPSEGRGGWSAFDFATLYVPIADQDPLASNEQKKMPSPFVFTPDDTVLNSYFSYDEYLSTNGIIDVDNLVFFLGMNGGDGSYINDMITNIKSTHPTTNIFVCMIPPAPKSGYNQTDASLAVVAREKQNLNYLKLFDKRKAEGVYLIPTHLSVNSEKGIQYETVDKHQFPTIDAATETYNDGIHPSDLGAENIGYNINNSLTFFS